MRALHAIYEDGKIHFTFQFPDYQGPVAVLVIFPDYEAYDLTDIGDSEELEKDFY